VYSGDLPALLSDSPVWGSYARTRGDLGAETFNIVVVCTGNRFRSPLVEHLLRRETAGLPIEIESFGLLDSGPLPVLPELEEHAAAAGVDVSRHRSRRLVAGSLADADLVVGFERRHVARAVVHAGAALDRAFTLPELVGLLEESPAPATAGDVKAGAAAAIARAAEERPADPRRDPIPEIADPLGRPPEEVAEIAREVRELTHRLVLALFER
jgi:protein-tyrosine phosphatase